jgi:alkylhydroperoxidase family enzyme
MRRDPVAFIDQIGDGEAAAAAAGLFEHDRSALGYVPNYTRLFAHRPAVYEAWLQLKGAIAAGMDERRYEPATVAAARRLRSSYCTLAHGRCFFSKTLDALGAEADPAYAALDRELRDVLTVGRPMGKS